MTRDVVTVEPATPLQDALTRARSHGIRHLPVLDGGRLAGVVTDKDLRLALRTEGTPADAAVRDVMTVPAITTSPDTPVESAAQLLIRHHIGCLPVVEDDALVGILTESDLLRAFVELMVGRERHSRIEILAPDRPGELARIVRVVGIDHRINITGVVVPASDGDRALIVLHLECEDTESLVTNLRQLGYEAGAPALPSRPE
ncbi:MAG TPA: CBS and ACT domain-containing protein [Longimicrobiales bacterium]|nr:CBS and ACT domain-containing protein [Longimicrobiales bacterium]